MDPAPLSDFLEGLCGKSEPFIADSKNDSGKFGGRGTFFFLSEMFGPFAAVLRRQRAIEEPLGSFREHATVPAMNEFLQFLAGTIAINADVVPAGLILILRSR
jgi:hypothetical protein